MAFLPLIALLALGQGQAAPADDLAKTWDSVQSSIEARFYARKTRKAEMDALFASYGPKARAAKTRGEFDRIVDEMIDKFGDSHFGFFTTDEQPYYVMDGLVRREYASPMPNIGAWFFKVPGGFDLRMLMEGGAAEKAGLRKGDIVVEADGMPFKPVDSFQGKEGKSVTLTVTRDGKPLKFSVVPVKGRATDMFLEASKKSARIIEFGGKKYAYFHLWTMGSDEFRKALTDEVYGEMKDTDGFILDIRDGFGGRPEGFGEPFQEKKPEESSKDKPAYTKPLVVLINHGSRSAKEVFSYLIKKSKRATLIGTNTAGNVLGTFPARINDWSYIEIPMVEFPVDGVRLEKVGVAPDIKVEPEFQDGKDLVLAKALDVLAQTVQHKPGQSRQNN
jgi:carboxyl-terminal processing protease